MTYKAKLHSLASTLSLTDIGLTLYSEVTGWPDPPKIDPKIREFTLAPSDSKGKILLPLVQGENGWANIYQYCIIAHALRLRGYEPLLVVCDGELDMCFKKSAPDDDLSCDKCQFRTTKLVERFGLEATNLSNIPCDVNPDSVINAADDPESLTFKSVDVSSFALANTRRFLKQYHIDLKKRQERKLFMEFLRTAITLTERMVTLVEDSNVVAATGANQAYNSSGIALRVADMFGAHTTLFLVGQSPGKIVFGGENLTNAFYSESESLTERLSTPLTRDEAEDIGRMMQGRIDGSTVRIQWSGESGERLAIDQSDRTVIGLFTNLMWDAALETESVSAFDDPFEWVGRTIDFLGNRDSALLVIKTHPAEAVRGTAEGIVEWVETTRGPLPENVVLLEPDTDVSPYNLIDQVDYTTVWNSTVGLESTYFGVPTIVAGPAHYEGLDFTFDANRRESYENIIAEMDLTMTDEMHKRAQRYCFHHFIDQQIEFPFYHQDSRKLQLCPVDSADLSVGKGNIDRVVNIITGVDTPT